jgi:hypothetical protein
MSAQSVKSAPTLLNVLGILSWLFSMTHLCQMLMWTLNFSYGLVFGLIHSPRPPDMTNCLAKIKGYARVSLILESTCLGQICSQGVLIWDSSIYRASYLRIKVSFRALWQCLYKPSKCSVYSFLKRSLKFSDTRLDENKSCLVSEESGIWLLQAKLAALATRIICILSVRRLFVQSVSIDQTGLVGSTKQNFGELIPQKGKRTRI